MEELSKFTFKMASSDDQPLLSETPPGLFDRPVEPDRALDYLQDPRHHLALALEGDLLVGFASGFHYFHPDKEPELFINEVAVRDEHCNRGNTGTGRIRPPQL